MDTRLFLHLTIASTLANVVIATLLRARTARCELNNKTRSYGVVTFRSDGAQVIVVCDLHGLPPGAHGLHVHERHDDDCDATGDHYDDKAPPGVHGGARGERRHRGDLGNVFVAHDGRCESSILADVRLDEIVGRSLVIHHGEDDLGRGTTSASPLNGSCGGRLACGRIL